VLVGDPNGMTAAIPIRSRYAGATGGVTDGPIASMDNYLIYRDSVKPMYSGTIVLSDDK